MWRTRWIVVCSTALLALLLSSTSASSGGVTSFEFEARYFVAGDIAETHTTVYFHDAETAADTLRKGPYYAYLLPANQTLDPPRIPSHAPRLGRVSFIPISHANNRRTARLRFVVPDVKPGSYSISLCNRPCRTTEVGDLIGGWIAVVSTREDARLRAMEDRVYERLQSLTGEIMSGLDERLFALEEAQNSQRNQSQARVAWTEKRYLADRERMEQLSAQVRDLQQGAEQGILAWLWMGGWIVAAGLAVAWRTAVVRRRRSTADPSQGAHSDGVMWQDLPPPVHDEDDHRRTDPPIPHEVVST